uniref:Uncharacterized protein n=1 Tax=Polynucleobacter necessarius subsp. necessarius (strain STIR1) TaxID=452638 RepID=B1XVW8_POLNS
MTAHILFVGFAAAIPKKPCSLEQAADAHRAAEGRKVSGAIVMTP